MNIEEIKNRCENFKNEYLPLFNNNGEMHEWNAMYQDNLYLLSIIEEAEKALEEVYECGSIRQAEIISGAALQVIRGK